MIYTERKVTIKNNEATIDSPILLYRGDREVQLLFTIVDHKYRFSNTQSNVINETAASYAQLAIALPNGTDLFTDIASTKNGTVVFTITGEMIDELHEVGFYSFHIRLFSSDKSSRITLPPIMEGVEIREPLVIEDDVEATDIVGEASVGYSRVRTVGVDEEVFDEDGNYIPTVWGVGDTITANKLNKIEEGISNCVSSNEPDVNLDGLVAKNEKGNANQILFSDGQSFQSKLDNGSLQGPKGDTGEQGIQGIQGPKGDNGLTTSIIVNGQTFTHENGVITLPDYPEVNGKQFSGPMTKAEYDAITDKDENTIYLVEDEDENTIIGLPNYTTDDANKILAVNAQGTALAWIDKPEGESGSVDLTGYAKTSDIPTKTSQLSNDSDFVNKSYVAAEISKVSVGGGAVFREPTLREVFSCTVPDNFSDCQIISIFSGSTTTGASVRLNTRISKCPNTPEVIKITTSNNMRCNKSELIFTRCNYYAPQYFIVTPIAPGEGTVTVTAPTGFTSTARFTITGEAIDEVEPDIVTILSINAVYTQGATIVYPDTSLDALKTGLIVTANYSDGSEKTVTGYSLSGALSVGTSTITVAFEGKTTTFNVVVTAKEEEPDTPEEPDVPPVVKGDYITDGLSHMVDFTQYPVGYTGDIVDAVTNKALVANGLASYTNGRTGFVEKGIFSPGPNRNQDDSVWAYIPESSMGLMVYPVTIEAYVRLRQNYDMYQADNVRKIQPDKIDATIFSTRDTETKINGAHGFWLRYDKSGDKFAIIETLNNTNISSPEGSATEFYAYDTADMVWTHLVVVFGPEDKRLYVNGELLINGGGGVLSPNNPCYFNLDKYDWKMLRMYNRALTANEVQNNYNVTIGTMGGNQ